MPDDQEQRAQANRRQLDQVNRSGFPLQIGVEDEIRALSSTRDPWHIVGAEVPWAEGFIDLVARWGPLLAVVECKRVDDQEWIFLVPTDDEPTIRTNWNFYDSREAPPGRPGLYLGEFTMASSSFEASMCVMSKKNSGNVTIERMCQDLIRASQGIVNVPVVKPEGELEILVPILVTTAKLTICKYNSRQIDPYDGIIPDGAATFEQGVPYVRFRKAFELLTEMQSDVPIPLAMLAEEHQQTVLVCNGACVKRLFMDLGLKITMRDGRYQRREEFY